MGMGGVEGMGRCIDGGMDRLISGERAGGGGGIQHTRYRHTGVSHCTDIQGDSSGMLSRVCMKWVRAHGWSVWEGRGGQLRGYLDR